MFSLLNIRVGWYLALRQIRRASKWTTGLIVFVMCLTFLNLVVVTGILVGIVDGIGNLFRDQQTGDVIVMNLDSKNYIENSQQVISFLETLPQIDRMTARYTAGGTIEANYKTRTDLNEKPNETGATIVGIDTQKEDAFSGLSGFMKEGEYLTPTDYDSVLVGSLLVDRYSFGEQPGLSPLRDIYPGSTIRLELGGNTREVVVKGIIGSTANSPISAMVFMPEGQMRQLVGRSDFNVSEIAMKLHPGNDAVAFRDLLKRSGVDSVGKVWTYDDAIPQGVAEVRNTFELLGNAFSSLGLIASSITIFIVIFINAVTRRKFIGILKGIGISGGAIEVAYMLQAFFYAIIGSGIGVALLYGFLVPYVGAHPIELPISRAILVAPPDETFVRIMLLVITTVIAGYIPARMIVRKNTLDSILGRE